MTLPSIESVVAEQARLKRKDNHLVYLGEDGFTMAHTDEERADIDLEDCPTHLWLEEHGRKLSLDKGYYWLTWQDGIPCFAPSFWS